MSALVLDAGAFVVITQVWRDPAGAVSATGDRILTSDAGDIGPLVAASGRSIHVVPC